MTALSATLGRVSDERWRSRIAQQNASAKVRIARLAGAQFGRVGARQLRALDVSRPQVARWIDTGYLHRVLDGVYAVGHTAPSVEADLVGALLYAAPGACLSHATALWWLELSEHRPQTIELTTTRRCRSLPGIVVHDRRDVDVTAHKRLRTTTVAQTLVDYAAQAPQLRVRKALAEAEFRRLLEVEQLTALLGRGKPGSASLRRALARHEPRLARARNDLELAFFALCERHRLPLPELNARVARFTVDALWREQRLAVELDGFDAHHTRAQMDSDRNRDLRLRSAGFIVVRYTWRQITECSREVAQDLRRLLGRSR